MPQQRTTAAWPPWRARLSGALAALAALAAGAGAQARPARAGEPITIAEAREQVKRQLEALLAAPPLAGAKVSVEVVSLEDGSLIFSRNADEQLNPASNTKLVTAAAALLRLGPEYRFTTDVLADQAPVNGRVKTLYVKGRGDPSFTTERLASLAADLAHRGLKQASELVLDDSWFDPAIWGPGWETEPSDTAYAAPSGALSLNHNSVGIYVLAADRAGQKAKVELEPEAKGYFVIDNQVRTLKAGARKRVVPHTTEAGDHTKVAIVGRLAVGAEPLVFYRRVTSPTLYFGHTLKQALAARGVRIDRLKLGATPEAAVLVASYESPALGEIIRDMNKVSSNFIAENLLRALAAETKGAPGTWPKGIEAAEEVLAELGIARGSYLLRNGSGLNDTNRLSAHQLVTVLTAMWRRFPVAAEFLASLPVAARDGTLRTRMEGSDAAGRLRAKTGTLEKVRKVTTLSGYLGTLSGERLAFSLLVNDWSGSRLAPVVQGVDKFGGMLASMGSDAAAREAQLAAAAQELSPAERKARVASYAQLGAAHDRKNLALLRGAARTERDPLVRAVAADALFRTDPDAGGGALLDALPATPELLVRLRELGRELQLPLSVVSALLDLGAEGNSEALTRLVALAPQARWAPGAAPPNSTQGPDEALEDLLAEGLLDVSEAAPEETLAALKAAAPPSARAAVELIALGLAASGGAAKKTAVGQLVLLAAAREGPEGEQARGWFAVFEHREPDAPPGAAGPVAGGVASPPPGPVAPPATAEVAPVSVASAATAAPPVAAAAPIASAPAAPAAPSAAPTAPPVAPAAPPAGPPASDGPPPGAPPHSLPANPRPLLIAAPPETGAPAPPVTARPLEAAAAGPIAKETPTATDTRAGLSKPRRGGRRRSKATLGSTDSGASRAGGG